MKKVIFACFFMLGSLISVNAYAQSDPFDNIGSLPDPVVNSATLTPVAINVVSNNVVISFSSGLGNSQIAITNSSGVTVFNQVIDSNVNRQYLVDITRYSTGRYNVEVVNSNVGVTRSTFQKY